MSLANGKKVPVILPILPNNKLLYYKLFNNDKANFFNDLLGRETMSTYAFSSRLDWGSYITSIAKIHYLYC